MPIQDFELLRYLVATGSMCQAARAFGVSPAVVSRQISARSQTGHPTVLSPNGTTGAYCQRPNALRDCNSAEYRRRSNAERDLYPSQRQSLPRTLERP